MDPNLIPTVNSVAPSGSSKKTLVAWLIFLLIISLGFNIFQALSVNKSLLKSNGKVATPLVPDLGGNVLGKITRIDGKKITVRSNTGVTGELVLGENLLINKFNPNPTASTSSALALSQSDLDKEVNLFVSYKEGELQVQAISFVSTSPFAQGSAVVTNPPVASISGSPKAAKP